MPESFLISDELLQVAARLIEGLQVNKTAIQRNLAEYGPFAAVERVLMGLVKAGADRQEMHERLRRHAMQAWTSLQAGSIPNGETGNPLAASVCADEVFLSYLPAETLNELMDAGRHLGDAAVRARQMAEALRLAVQT